MDPVDSSEENVKFIRMNTGEDIISQIVEIKENDTLSYVLINPLKILYTMGNTPGYLQISLMEWVFTRICEEQEFTVFPNDIITMAIPASNLIEYYWGSIEHFNKMRKAQKQRIKFSEDRHMEESEDFFSEEPTDEHESFLQMMEYLKNSNNKRKLH